MANVTLDIPDDVLAKFKSGVEAGNALRLAAAFSLCRQGELSTSQAAPGRAGVRGFSRGGCSSEVRVVPGESRGAQGGGQHWSHSGSPMRRR